MDPLSNAFSTAETYNSRNAPMYLLQNGHPLIDAMVHPREWILDTQGQQQAMDLIHDNRLHSIHAVYSSPEIKAIQTIRPLADFLNLHIIEVDGLKEVAMDRYYENEQEYYLMQEAKFLNPSLDIGESHTDALQRFSSTIEGIRAYSSNKAVMISTHRTVLTLYLGYLNGMTSQEMFRYWMNLPYCYVEQI